MVVLLLMVAHMPASTMANTSHSSEIAWRDTGLVIPTQSHRLCFDALQPDSVLVDEAEVGTVAYNWVTGQRTVVSTHHLGGVDKSIYKGWYSCGSYGLFFDAEPSSDLNAGAVWRFTASDPVGQTIPHMPIEAPQDGTFQLYAVGSEQSDDNRVGWVWASADGGLTWTQREMRFDGQIESLAVAQADARALYVVVVDRPSLPLPPSAIFDTIYLDYTIYFSPDAGATWEQRFTGRAEGFVGFGGPRITLNSVPGSATQVDALMLVIDSAYPGSSHRHWIHLSSDGARTFHRVGTSGFGGWRTIVQTADGLVQLDAHLPGSYELSRSTDGGATWQPMAGPPAEPDRHSRWVANLYVVRTAPANLILSDGYRYWYSADSGATWQPIADADLSPPIFVSPFLPVTVLRVSEGRIQILDLPDTGERPSVPAPPVDSPDLIVFPETGYALRGGFKQYWEQHGGLPIFGYPISAVFMEERPEEGRSIMVQYFERSRFEYHPYHTYDRSVPSGLMLGLLGNEVTEERRAAGEVPFNPVKAPDDPCVAYFPETGHTLRGGFRQYWETHGGAAIFGYPISEEFPEVNPEDGQSYTVQYFERSRFEYHPERRGLSSDVLLTRLGDLLRNEQE